MAVLVVSTLASAPWGGSEILWAAAAERLVDFGTPVVAVTHRSATTPPALQSLASRGVELRSWHRAGRFRRALHKAGIAQGPRVDGDVVLVNMASAHDLVTAVVPRSLVRRAVESGHPYVLAPHSLVERRISERNRALLAGLYGGAAAVVLPSLSMREDLERQLATHLHRCVEVATPTPLLDRAVPPWPEDAVLRLACVARLDVEQKGHDVLLAALSRVSWRDDTWTLDLYGSGPDEAYVRSLVDFFGLADHVTLRGHVDGVEEIWRNHHALVLPSRREARGIAITEAMAAGRPVLGTAIGGIPDSVLDGVTGLLAPAPTARALAETLERLWRERAELPSWGAAARAHVERLFDHDPAERLVDVLRAVQREGRQ